MSREIIREAELFLCSVKTGGELLLVYDMLRIIRTAIPHKGFVVAAEDLLYWIFNAWSLFVMMYENNSGNVRGYVIAGVMLGMLLYNRTAGRLVSGGLVYLEKLCKLCENAKKRLKKSIKQSTIRVYNYFKVKVGSNNVKENREEAQ